MKKHTVVITQDHLDQFPALSQKGYNVGESIAQEDFEALTADDDDENLNSDAGKENLSDDDAPTDGTGGGQPGTDKGRG